MTARPFYELSEAADSDLFEIYLYTDRTFGTRQADVYLTELNQAFSDLCRHPKSGRPRDEVRKGLRSFSKNSHVIFYRIKTDRIWIVRVLAMSQDIQRAFR